MVTKKVREKTYEVPVRIVQEMVVLTLASSPDEAKERAIRGEYVYGRDYKHARSVEVVGDPKEEDA